MALNQALKTFAESIGLKTDEDFAYGVFNDYHLTVFSTSYYKAVFVNFAKPDIISDEEARENDDTDNDEDDNAADESADGVKETAENAADDNAVNGADDTYDIDDGSIIEEDDEAEEDEDEEYEDDEDDEDENDVNKSITVDDFAFSSEFQNALRDYDIISEEIDENGVFIETSSSLVKFRDIIEKTTALLKKYGYAGCAHCSSCGRKINDSTARRVYRDKFNYIVCSECAEELLDEEKEKNAQTEEALKGASTGKAVGFSLLSSFILSVIMIASYRYLLPAVPIWGSFLPGYFACVIPFAMAALNMTIYKKTAKDSGVKRILISLFIALVFTAVTQYACSVILFIRSGAQTLAEAKEGVSPLTASQLANARMQILKTPLVHDKEWYMFYKYLLIDFIAILTGILSFGFSTVQSPEKPLNVVPFKRQNAVSD